jgi:3-oxoacyl-[acyl-carrier protein] reductase
MSILTNKTAVLFGAAGGIGSAVAKAFAREGATVFLSGRNLEPVKRLQAEIASTGGHVHAHRVDALDPDAVDDYLSLVTRTTAGIDIVFNAVGVADVQGIPLLDMKLEDYERPIALATTTQFITSTATARRMTERGRGVIILITASPARMGYPNTGGFGVACAALEGFTRSLASEVGRRAVRVVCLRSAGSPDAPAFNTEVLTNEKIDEPERLEAQQIIESMTAKTMLGRLPLTADVANVAAFVASDLASPMTGTVVNLTCGTTVD